MQLAEHFRKEWAARRAYERFELCFLTFLLFFISVLALWATWLAVQNVMLDFAHDKMSLQNVALQEGLGSILTVLILLEFNHSIVLAIQQRSGAIQVRLSTRSEANRAPRSTSSNSWISGNFVNSLDLAANLPTG